MDTEKFEVDFSLVELVGQIFHTYKIKLGVYRTRGVTPPHGYNDMLDSLSLCSDSEDLVKVSMLKNENHSFLVFSNANLSKIFGVVQDKGF